MKRNAAVVSVVLLGLLAGLASAEVKPANIFQNHMVLQCDRPLTIWGTADAGEKVTVAFGDQSVETTAGDDGKWKVELKPLKTSATPAVLTIGDKKISDVLVGEVWLCSGQSNMGFTVSRAKNAAKDIADAKNHPTIRLCKVRNLTSPEGPKDDTDISWAVCDSKTVGGFSAVGYFFGRELNEKLGVPVGLINSSWGGTPAEAWTSRPKLETLEFMTEPLARSDKAVKEFDLEAAKAAHAKKVAEWKEKKAAAKAKAEKDGKPFNARAWRRQPRMGNPLKSPHTPATLFNAMINPLVPFGIRGAIWYQGESNARRHADYDALMRAMITDWRERFVGQGDFPFYYVQLANFLEVQTEPVQDLPATWPYLREAQLKTLGLKNTGMASAIDLADENNPRDIHPKNKQDVGKRLSLWALANAYGQKDLVYSGPLFKEMTVADGKATLSFDHLGGGLIAKGGEELKGFAVTGDGTTWVWADAKIDGDTVVVSAEGIATPKAVRYDWGEQPDRQPLQQGRPARRPVPDGHEVNTQRSARNTQHSRARDAHGPRASRALVH